MLGVPRRDHARFHRWTSRLVSPSTPAEALLSIPAALRFPRYIRGLIEERRARPGDDLLSAPRPAGAPAEGARADRAGGGGAGALHLPHRVRHRARGHRGRHLVWYHHPALLVVGSICSANRDEQHFADPDVLDLGREPN